MTKQKDTYRRYPDEFNIEAVHMLLDGHSTLSVLERLGLLKMNMLFHWRQERLTQCGSFASLLEARVRELEDELRRVERKRTF